MTYFRSFQHVANEYADTKPINEREYARNDPQKKPFGTSRNIRPIDSRSRKWERIQKISDTCYALMCGHTYGDTCFNVWRFKDVVAKPDIVASYAPIAWHHIEGKDVVSISNAHYGHPTVHHQFLNRWLPRGMSLVNRNGKHFLEVQQESGGVTYSLRRANPDEKQVKYNTYNLKFTSNGDGTFAPYKLPATADKKAVKRVDTDLKKRFKVRLEEFNQWVMAMGPLFPKDWKSRDEAQRAAAEYIQKVPSYHNHRLWTYRQIPPELAREALIYPNHPLRFYIGIEAWSHINGAWGDTTPEAARSRLRSFNNKVFGFEKEVDVDI